MGNAVDAADVQPVVEHFEVEHRAVQRRQLGDASGVAQDLFGVIALMATRALHLARQAGGQFRQGSGCWDAHRQRQHVQYRAGRAQRRRPHPAHKNHPGGEVVAPAQAANPQGNQCKSHVGRIDAGGVRQQRLNLAVVELHAAANQLRGRLAGGERLV